MKNKVSVILIFIFCLFSVFVVSCSTTESAHTDSAHNLLIGTWHGVDGSSPGFFVFKAGSNVELFIEGEKKAAGKYKIVNSNPLTAEFELSDGVISRKLTAVLKNNNLLVSPEGGNGRPVTLKRK